MSNKLIACFLTLQTSLLCAALVGIVGATVRAALADAPSPNFITVEMSLATSDTIMQGEPIMLHFKINNDDNVDYTAMLGTESKGWYSIQVSDLRGRPVSSRNEARPLSNWEKNTNNPVTIQYRRFSQGYIVPKPLFVTPGKYTLSVHVHLRYGVDPDTGVTTTVPLPDRMTGVYESDYSFPLTITPPNADRLQARAAALEKGAANIGSKDWPPALVEELCSMPEEQA